MEKTPRYITNVSWLAEMNLSVEFYFCLTPHLNLLSRTPLARLGDPHFEIYCSKPQVAVQSKNIKHNTRIDLLQKLCHFRGAECCLKRHKVYMLFLEVQTYSLQIILTVFFLFSQCVFT